MLVDPQWFVARGASIEQARADALQAERASVMSHVRCEHRRWYTHDVLPPDPRPRDRLYWSTDPWALPEDPIAYLPRSTRR